MDNLKGMMDKFLEGRLEYISNIGDDEQKIIDSLRKDIDIRDYVSDLTDEQMNNFEKFMDDYRDNVNAEIDYYEQRYYKLGASEIVTFLAECLMMKKL